MEFVEQKAYAEAKSDSSRTPGSLDATPETDCKSTTKEGVGYEVKDGGAQFASGHEMMDPTCETGTDLPTVTSAPTSDGSPGDFSAGNTGKTSDVATTETAASAQTGTEASVKKMVESSHKGTGLDSCKNVQEATLSSQEGAPKCCTEMDAVTRAQQTPSSSVNDGSNDSSLKCVAKSAGMQDPTVTTFSDASHAEGEIGVKLSKQENLNVELALGPTKNEEIHTQLSVTNSAISGDDSSKGTFEPSSAIAARLKETKMTLTQRDEVASVDVSEDSGDSRPKVEPVVCSSPAVPPNSTTVEIAPSKLSTSCSNVVSSERDLTLDSTVNKKQPSEEVDSSDCGFTFEGGVGVVKDGGAQFARGHEMMDLTCESGMDLPTVTSAPTSDGSPGDFSAGNTGKNSDMSTTETTASAQTGTEASVKEMVESSHKGTGLDSRKNVQEESTLSSQEGAPRCCTETDAVTRAEQKPSSSVNDGSNDSSFKCVAKSAGMQDPTVTTFSDASHAEGEIGVKLSKQENLNVELAIGPTKNEGIHTQLSVTNSAISGDDSSKGTFEPSSAIAARLKETNMTLTQRDEVASVDVSEDSSDSRPKVEPVLCSSPAVPPNSTTVEIAPSKLPSSCSNVVSSERDPTLDSTVNKKQPSEEVDSSDRGFTTEGGVGLVKDGGAQFARGHEMTDPTCESGTDLPTVTSAPTSDGSPGDFSAGNTGKTSDVATTESTTSAQTGTEASVKEMVESSHKDTGLDSPKNVQEESTLSSQEGAPRCCTETDAVTRAEQKPSSSVNDGSNDSSLKCVAKSAGMQDSTVTTFSDASHAEGEIGVNLSKQENLNVELAIGPTKNEGIHTQLSVTNSAISGDDSSKGTFEPSSAIAARLKETNMTLTQRDEVASVDVSEDSSDSRPKVEPVLCSSPAVPPNSTTVEIAPSKLPTSCSSCSNVVSSERDPTLDSTVNKKQPSEEVDSSDRGFTTEGGVGLENGEVSSTVSTEAGTGTDMEGGHGVTAGSLDSPGCMEPGSDREDFDEEIELHPRLYRAHLDDDSGINNSTHGLEDELEDGLDEEDDDGDCLKGERQQGDGEESVDPSDLQDKVLDFDEDKRNPQYIPKKGAFYQHDVRMVGDEDSSEVPEEKNDDDKGSRRPKKLWHDEGVWGHDMYREEEQGPKSSEELVSIYGYDIRSEQMPPRARRRRRYGRGPNKYERSWEDEEAYTPRSGSGRGGGARGGRRTRGGSLVENPQFHDEDFPDLHSKPSENTATLQQNSAEVKPSARPAGFKGSDLTGSNSSQQEQWDNTVKGSGMTHRGRGKRPSQHSRAVPDAPSRQQDCDVKEDASLGHRVGRPAPQSPVKAVEAPQVSPAAGRSRAIRHLLTEQEQSKREYEALKKFAAKGELQDGDNTDLKRSTATTVTPRGGPVGSSECAAKPRRYSSLRQRPLAEAVPYTETAVVSPQLPNTPAPLPMPNQPQPAILTSAHFQAPYAPYSDGYMLPPPGQAPTVMPTQNQPPPVMAAPSPLSSSYLPPPTGIVSFPAQYPPPYSFPAQYAAPASTGAPAPTPTQAQKPPYYHGDITYYNTQSQQHKRPSPPRRPKVAIPIVPPPESQGISQENVDRSDLQDKVLDFDEDKRYPQYIPKKGAFYQHDDRVVGDEDSSEVPEEKTEYDKGSRRPKKLWHEECVWEHDMYREEEQGPKSSEEIVRIYGYDIRLELMPPRARRWRRYGRGPNKYERSWEDKEAYSLRSRSERGGGACGGRRTRGGSLVENPQFHDEDFPDLHSKPSENTATMQLNRAEVKSSAKPAGFKGSDLTGSNSSQQEKWDNTMKGSGMTHWGWGKRPSLPPRAVPDAPPKQQDSDVKEDVPLGHRVSSPAPQSPVMAVEAPQVSTSACRSRAIQHLLSKHDQSKRKYEALKKLAAKGELQGGDNTDLKRSTATTVTPRGGPVRSFQSEAKPSRYSSLRQRSLTEEDGDFTSTVSTAGEAGTGTDLEGGHGVTADSLDSTGRIEPYSDQEDFDGETVLDPGLRRGDLDDDSGINTGTRGLEDELEECLDKEDDDEDCLKGERQQDEGKENDDHFDLQDKVLDFDEDKRYPQYIPKKGAFYQHDDRVVGDEDSSEVPEEKTEDDKGSRRPKKLWHEECVWEHDMYREEEQGPKSSEELVRIYGYDIRSEPTPPRARRWRRYGRGPNKYERSWKDEEASAPRSRSGRSGGARGGRRTRGGSLVENRRFHDEDFPDLHSKPSENTATMQLNRAEVKSSARPAGFKGSDLTGSKSSQQEKWDNTVKGSGMTYWGCGKRPSLPPRAIPDAPPKQQDCDVKEDVPLGHGVSSPAPQSPVMAVEAPQVSPSACRSRAIQHLPSKHDQSKKEYEALKKFAAKRELQDGDNTDLKRSTATTVTPRGGPVGSSQSEAKPSRYSSLRLRSLAEEDGDFTSTVSTAGEAGTSTDLEGGHRVTADSLDSTGRIEPYSDQEDFDGKVVLLPQLHRGDLDDDSGINNGTCGLEDELEDGLDKKDDDEDCLKGEKQQDEGKENVDPFDLQDKVLDFDEDKRYPQYIPKKGAFYQHDDRVVGDEASSEVPEEKTEDDKGSRRPKKLWHEECVWEHDMYREEEQGPKSSEELVRIYGYDIRSEPTPPRARRWRRYGRGPNKYERSWKDEEASAPRSRSGRSGGARGGRRTRAESLVENRRFHDEDFPDLHSKPSENTATMQLNRAEVKSSARPAGFKGSDLTGSKSSQQEKWDNTVKGSGMTYWGCGKRPSLPPRAIPDAPPKQQDCDVKEDVPLGHGVSSPAPQSPVMAVEAPQVSPSACRSRAIQHLPSKHDQSKKEYEALKKFAAKRELQDGDNTDLKRNTATTVTPRGGPVGSSQSEAKPSRYSSLRQRSHAEEDGDFTSTVSTAGEAGTGTDLEGGHGVTADSLDSTGRIEPYSDQEEFDGKIVLHPRLHRGDLDDESGINNGTCGLENELEDGLDKEDDDEDCFKGERQQDEGEEDVNPSDLQDKVLDFDEDERYPQYIPRKGAFYQHDDRVVRDEDSSEVPEEKTEDDKGSRRPKKLWHEECVWEHDMYREEEQGPKSSEELVRIYGYDIRLELMPPRARRWRRYGRGPNKYERSWENEEAYTLRSRSGHSGGARGGHRTRGGSLVENPQFHDEDFPNLHSKPSENTATMQLNRAEVKSSARPAGFKGSDSFGKNSSQQEKWDHTVKGSGMTHWGWRKGPSLPSRTVPYAPPKQQDYNVKEDVPLGHRVGRPASQSPMMAVEAPQVSPSACRSRAIQHLLSKHDQSKREYEALKKLAAKGELEHGDNTDLKRSTATTVTSRGGPVRSSQSEAKPSRYSSLRQRSFAEEDGDFTSTVSTAGEAGTGTDLEGGHGVTADSLDSTGRIKPYSDQEDFDGKIVLHPQLHRGDLDDDSGINNGTRGLEDELEDGLDEEDDDEDCLKGERQQDEGKENVDPSDLQDKVLDFDEDERYPQYIPKKGAFYQHDDRVVRDEDSSEVPEEKTEYDKGSRRPKKLWHEECVWEHDMYREEEQGPKSSEEIVRIYGYDIRLELMPPRARRWRRYGRGPNKYERSWEDKEAYSLRSRSECGGGACGGRRTRGGSLVENPQFHDEDFPDLHSKPSENTATMQLNRAEVKSSAKPAGFKGSDLTGSNSSQQEKWDNTVKGSGMTHWGWGKRPSLPPRAVPDAPPKQQDSDVKEDVPLGHRVSSPAPQSPVMAVEAPQVSTSACRSRAIQHLLSKHDQSKRKYEALKKLAAKGELQGGDSTDLKRSTATTGSPRRGPVGSSESEAKPRRYSSLRKHSPAKSFMTCLSAAVHEDEDFTSTVSTAGEAGTGTDLEGGHGVTADSIDSTGLIEPYSDQEDFVGKIVLHPRLHRGDLDDDSGINNGTRGLEDELEECLDKEDDDEDCLKGERQQDEGKENVDPFHLQDKVLDFDEDKRYPQYIPKKGAFYQHDDRVLGDEDSSEIPEEKTEHDKGSLRPKKLWHEEGVWDHDMYREEEQGPKSSEELVRIYGYDIRSELMPPRARRWRRYGRGPKKYERSWEDEETYTLRSRSGRGGGARGGCRTRGGSLVENPQFHDEDFPDLHSKPSENTATVQLNRAEVKSSAKPAGFKGSDLTGSNSSQQEKWDNTVKGSGMTHWGWGKSPSLPPWAVPDAPPKQQDSDVKEDVPLGHRVTSPAPQSLVMAVEAPQVSPPAGRSRAIQHLLSKHDQSKRKYEALKKLAAKGELQGGDNTDLKRSTATTVTPRGGRVGSSESEAKPSRYSSLRKHSPAKEDGNLSSTVSTAGEGGTGTDLEDGHGVTADSLDSPGRIEPYSDQEDFDGEIVLDPGLHKGDLDDDSGINTGTRGLEDELEKCLDEEDDDENCIKGERQQDEGKEDGNLSSTVSTAGEGGTGTDLEDSHGVTADSLDSPGRIEPYSDQEDFDGEIVFDPGLHRGDLDDDSGINTGTRGLEDELEKCLDEEDDDEDCLKGERQQDEGKEDGNLSSTVSTAGEGDTGTDLEDGHGVTADSLDSPGRIEPYSDQEDFDGEIVFDPGLHRGDLDDDSGINNGTRGLEDELEDGLDEEDDDEDCLKGERQQDEGKENVDPFHLQDKVLDFDEDKRYPQYIPKKGAFYQHDDRVLGDEDSSEVPEEKTEHDKGSRRPKKLWHDEGVWGHDMYREEEQGPKSREELVSIYGYDIRSEQMPPRARRRRRYGRGPNKYERSWEDEEAYTPRSGSGRGEGACGGRSTRAGSYLGDPGFYGEDFADLHSKPSENAATMQQNRAEVKSSDRPAGFKGSDWTGSNSSQQEKWDHTVKGSGMTHCGWGKRPSLPSRAVPDAPPKQQDCDVKEDVPLGHRVSSPAPQLPVMAVEVPQVSPTAGTSRAIQHLLSKDDQSKREYEALKELAAKGELQGGSCCKEGIPQQSDLQ